MNLSKLLVAASIAFPLLAQAGVVPSGIQSNVSTATAAGWGWKECHRSSASSYGTPISSILDACKGDYLMMGYATNADTYAILGAGAYQTVTKITHADYSSDDYAPALNNWSNGLNFYLTSGYGSWGFTTNSVTALNSADVFLDNGLNNYNGPEGSLTKGLSFHVSGGNMNAGWAYNITGNNLVSVYNGQRVFLTYSENKVPEPGILLLLAIGAAGVAASRRRA